MIGIFFYKNGIKLKLRGFKIILHAALLAPHVTEHLYSPNVTEQLLSPHVTEQLFSPPYISPISPVFLKVKSVKLPFDSKHY